MDTYVILDSTGTKIAQIEQTWNSDRFISFIDPDLKTTAERTERFNTFTEDEIREYDPPSLILETFPSDVAEKKRIEYQYEYYTDAKDETSTHYKHINMDALHFIQERQHYEMVDSEAKSVWRFQRNYTANQRDKKDYYKTAYIIDDVKSQSSFLVLNVYRVAKDIDSAAAYFELQATGDGKVGGDVKKDTYLNLVQVDYFNDQPIYVTATLGAKKTNRTRVESQKSNDDKYTENFTGTVKIREQTLDADGNWVTQNGETKSNGEKKGITVPVLEIGENCDCMSVSDKTTEVDANGVAVTVPASMTYYAHFEKDGDGNYPALDKYMQITCYPEYDEAHGRIVYKVTEKSIDDFIAAYKADFATLAASVAN